MKSDRPRRPSGRLHCAKFTDDPRGKILAVLTNAPFTASPTPLARRTGRARQSPYPPYRVTDRHRG
jgi:hypothetical protein